MKRLTALLFILVMICSGIQAQNYMDEPECVVFDEAHNRYLVSDWGNGTIIQLDPDGTQSEFLTGFGHLLGCTIVGNTFYTSTGTRIYGFDLDTKETVMNLYVSGSTQLDGMAGDSSGYLYVLDYRFNSTVDRVYQIDLTAQTYSIFLETNDLAIKLQDVIFDAELNRLLIVGFSDAAPIQAVSLNDTSITTLVTTPMGNFDGIAMDSDRNIYVSSWATGAVHKYDTTFTNPPITVVDGISGPSNICMNGRDDILAIPRFNEGWVQLYNVNINIEPDANFGQIPTEINFTANTLHTPDGWLWDFGDGETSTDASPAHSYDEPGIYDVAVTIDCGGKSYTDLKYELIYALADSLIAPEVTGEAGEKIEVVIYGSNTAPISRLRIPVEYGGTMNLTLDSFSTVGCRTEYFDNITKSGADPLHWEATFNIYNSSTSGTPDLDPGSGPVLKLYFTIPSSAAFGKTANIILDGYDTYTPYMLSAYLNEGLTTVDGSIKLPGICGDITGDGVINIIDITYLIAYVYTGGPAPVSLEASDVNHDYAINILDIVHLINFLYKSGPDPFCG